jgi:diguanylate cyclase (GGDEF)-like protein
MSRPEPQNRRHPLSSLATKIILFVFASTFATAIIVSWASIQSTHDSLRDMLDHLYPATLEQVARQLRPEFETASGELEALAADPAVRARRHHDTTQRLARLLEEAPHWRGLARVDPDGTRIATAGNLPEELERLTSRVNLADGTQHPVLWMPVPGAGAVVGVLEGGAIASVLAGALPAEATTLALVDANGDVLSATGARAGTLRDQTLPRPRDGQRPTSEYDSGGQPVIGAALPLGRDGWELVIETPFHVAFAPVLESVSRIFVIDLVVILLFSFLAYRVTGAVVRPIERLSDWARRIAQGQTDLEFPDTGGRDELGLLARTFNDMMRQLRRNQEEIETANRSLLDRNLRLQQANEVLNQLSITDGLTKLHNHRFFQDHLTREIKRVSRTGESLAMLLIDIDDFKQLNDRFGHAAGDEMLKRIAPLLNQAVRETDLVARYGGEEFVILALNTDAQGAYPLAEKVRTSIAESSFILDDSLRPLRITVSVGVATYRGNRKRFFQRADEALYRAKAQGKNCVVLDDEDTGEAGSNHA